MTPRRKDTGEPGNGGRFARRLGQPSGINLDGQPTDRSSLSRRAILDVMGTLSAHHDAITLIGAHAVALRTQSLNIPMADTGDGDLGLTPGLVGDEPVLTEAMLSTGWEHRTTSRPGLWGKGRRELADGRAAWDYQVDLIVGSGMAGKLKSQQRSVPALAGQHGKMSAGNTPGVELSAYDRSLMRVPDLADPTRSTEMYVAGSPALVVAKAYKLGERLDRGGDRLRDKDAGDLWRLLETTTPDELRRAVDDARAHLGDAACDEMTRRVSQVLTTDIIVVMAGRSLEEHRLPDISPDETFRRWRNDLQLQVSSGEP